MLHWLEPPELGVNRVSKTRWYLACSLYLILKLCSSTMLSIAALLERSLLAKPKVTAIKHPPISSPDQQEYLKFLCLQPYFPQNFSQIPSLPLIVQQCCGYESGQISLQSKPNWYLYLVCCFHWHKNSRVINTSRHYPSWTSLTCRDTLLMLPHLEAKSFDLNKCLSCRYFTPRCSHIHPVSLREMYQKISSWLHPLRHISQIYTAGELKQDSEERSCVIKNQIIHVLLQLLLHFACRESYLLIEIHDKVYD